MTRRKLIVLAWATSMAVAACLPFGPTGPSASTNGSPGATTGNSPAPPSLPTQTETDFGRIWDAAPPSFPRFPGSAPATDPGGGAASSILAINSADIRAIATFYRDALQARGLVASIDGPLEDAAMIVSGMDGDGCEVEVGVRPTGATTLIVVLYGAGCSFE